MPVRAAMTGLSSSGSSAARPVSSAAASASATPETVLWPALSTSSGALDPDGAGRDNKTDTGEATSGAPSGEWRPLVKKSPIWCPAGQGALNLMAMAREVGRYVAATCGKPAWRSPAATSVRSMTTTGPFWTFTTNADTVAGSTGPCTPTTIVSLAGTTGTAAVGGSSSGTEFLWMGKPHKTAISFFDNPDISMAAKPPSLTYACRIASSWKSSAAAAAGEGLPRATTSYPAQCGSICVGSVALQVSGWSSFKSAIVGEPTTWPPAASRMPLA